MSAHELHACALLGTLLAI